MKIVNGLAVCMAAALVAAALAGPAMAQANTAASSAPAATASSAPAQAAPSADAPVDTYKSVMGQGFEIKAVTLFAGDQQDLLLGKTGSLPAVMVTLQKQQQTAVCIFTAAAWENLQIAALDTSKNCSVY